MLQSLTVAIIQHRPVYLDLPASLDKAVHLIEEAAAEGARLIVFGETWFCGYPAWLDHCPNVALWDHEPTKEIYARMIDNGLCIPGKEVDILAQQAKKHQVFIVAGANEVVRNGSLYNVLLTFSPDEGLVNHHRKLVPTFTERLLHGHGDGAGLKTTATPFGKLGGLICWEHWMPLSRQVLHQEGELIHAAVWPMVHDRHQLASRHYAFEGRCFVIAAGQILQVKDLPEELEWPNGKKPDPDHFLLRGGSCIIGPDGQYLLEPVFNKEETIIFEIEDLRKAQREKLTLETAGHYFRPDVFQFSVNRQR